MHPHYLSSGEMSETDSRLRFPAPVLANHWSVKGCAVFDQDLRITGGQSALYMLDSFTLTLRASDGRIWQINAYPPAAAPRPRRVVMNGRVLVRN